MDRPKDQVTSRVVCCPLDNIRLGCDQKIHGALIFLSQFVFQCPKVAQKKFVSSRGGKQHTTARLTICVMQAADKRQTAAKRRTAIPRHRPHVLDESQLPRVHITGDHNHWGRLQYDAQGMSALVLKDLGPSQHQTSNNTAVRFNNGVLGYVYCLGSSLDMQDSQMNRRLKKAVGASESSSVDDVEVHLYKQSVLSEDMLFVGAFRAVAIVKVKTSSVRKSAVLLRQLDMPTTGPYHTDTVQSAVRGSSKRRHYTLHKQLFVDVGLPLEQVDLLLRHEAITYRLDGVGAYTPDFIISGIPPVAIESQQHALSSDCGHTYPYETRHRQCAELARQHPGVRVYVVCGHGEQMRCYKYTTQGNRRPISSAAYTAELLRTTGRGEGAHRKRKSEHFTPVAPVRLENTPIVYMRRAAV